VYRARKIQRFLSQPFHVAEVFTSFPGKFVELKDTISGFKAILDGKYDDTPESAFYMVGPIEEVEQKARSMAAAMGTSKEKDKDKDKEKDKEKESKEADKKKETKAAAAPVVHHHKKVKRVTEPTLDEMSKYEYDVFTKSIDAAYLQSLPVWKRVQFTMWSQIIGLAIDYRHKIRLDPLNASKYIEKFQSISSLYEDTLKKLKILGGPGLLNPEDIKTGRKIVFQTPLELNQKGPKITPKLSEEELKKATAMFKELEDNYRKLRQHPPTQHSTPKPQHSTSSL